jgi:hypothetical protein
MGRFPVKTQLNVDASVEGVKSTLSIGQRIGLATTLGLNGHRRRAHLLQHLPDGRSSCLTQLLVMILCTSWIGVTDQANCQAINRV